MSAQEKLQALAAKIEELDYAIIIASAKDEGASPKVLNTVNGPKQDVLRGLVISYIKTPELLSVIMDSLDLYVETLEKASSQAEAILKLQDKLNSLPNQS